MSIRQTIAAAVFVAAVAAPTALVAGQAVADTGPVGQSQPDASVPDAAPAEATPAADTPAPAAPAAPTAPAGSETPAAPAGSEASEAPAGTETPSGSAQPAAPALDEAALRARLDALLAEPGHSSYYYEAVAAAKGGTAEEIRQFLDTGLTEIHYSDRRVQISQAIYRAGSESRIGLAGRKALDDGSRAAIDHFLDVELPALLLSDDRVRISQLADEPGIGARLRQAALDALEGGDEAVAAFIEQLPELRFQDDLLRASRAMSDGGPEVRKAAGAALDAGTPEALRAFIATGLAEARAKDAAASGGQQQGGGQQGGGQQQGGGTGVTPVSDEAAGTPQTAGSGTTGTTATGATATGGTTTATGLASTGTDAPVGALTVGGATAILLGAGTLVAARRRRQQS
ncbi:ALF repeat-containing protein [Kitasatospora sp. NPDC004272]